MGLRNIEATLPPGFRFCPSDEELVCHYLYKKIVNEKLSNGTLIVEVNLHLCEPWQLPDAAKVGAKEWYFFSFRDRKYATGFRSNRATANGFWKATGKDRPVFDLTTNAIVGMRKTLVFYLGRAPNGIKTGWVMHEFRLENQNLLPKEDWVLCRVTQKAKEQLYMNHCQETDSRIAMRSSSPELSSSPRVDQTKQLALTQQFLDDQESNPNAWSYTFLEEHQLKELYDAPITATSPRSGDESLFDMCLRNIALQDEQMPCYDEMGIEDDTSVVLL